MTEQGGGRTRQHDIQFFDGRAAGLLMESIGIHSLIQHTALTAGLAGVRDRGEGMSMELMLSTAEEWTLDDVFIEWAEQYTPFRYSAKKKRMVRRNGGRWDLDGAFSNPAVQTAERLESEVEKFKKGKGLILSAPVDLEEFIDYLNGEVDERRRLIEARIERNRRRGKRSGPSQQTFEPEHSAPETDVEEKARPIRQRKRRKTGKRRNRNPADQGMQGVAASPQVMGSQLTLSPEELAREQTQREIMAYLARNPLPDPIGPMGVPQSKYRYGTYGLGSMEFDSWRRS